MESRRVDGLVFERIGGELLIYSPKTGESHALNATAAVVFELCDGTHSREAMAAEVAHRCGLPPDEAIVDLALAELTEAGVVQADGDAPPPVTRRALIRRLGLTAIAAAMLPFVETVVMPSTAAAAPVKLPVCA
jgi:hypothetical protein